MLNMYLIYHKLQNWRSLWSYSIVTLYWDLPGCDVHPLLIMTSQSDKEGIYLYNEASVPYVNNLDAPIFWRGYLGTNF